jgi:phage terminase Nu1 subunit (DNA packaging protein)
MGIYLTKKELATIAGYTYRRLHDIDMGLPENGKLFVKGEGGKYDLALFVQRWVQYNVDNETGDDQTLDEVKAKHEIVKTRKTELEVARLEGKLVDVYEIRRLWGGVANTVMQNMLRLPSKVSPRLVMMKDVEMIASIIDGEIRDTLMQISETPLPLEAASEETDEEESEEE